jgi:hypothetical protein
MMMLFKIGKKERAFSYLCLSILMEETVLTSKKTETKNDRRC